MSIIDRSESLFDYSSLTMQNSLIDNFIRYEFRSILKLFTHFSISLIQLLSVLTILALQIALIITQTCAYHIGIGF